MKRLRKENGLTLEALGEAAGLSYATIGAWELGRAAPDLLSLVAVADALAVRPADLLTVAVTEKPEDTQDFSPSLDDDPKHLRARRQLRLIFLARDDRWTALMSYLNYLEPKPGADRPRRARRATARRR